MGTARSGKGLPHCTVVSSVDYMDTIRTQNITYKVAGRVTSLTRKVSSTFARINADRDTACNCHERILVPENS